MNNSFFKQRNIKYIGKLGLKKIRIMIQYELQSLSREAEGTGPMKLSNLLIAVARC